MLVVSPVPKKPSDMPKSDETSSGFRPSLSLAAPIHSEAMMLAAANVEKRNPKVAGSPPISLTK